MKVFEIYFSPTGTSRRVAHAVAAALAGPDQAPVDTIDATRVPVAGAKLPPDGVAIVAVPVYGGRVAPLALQRLEGLSGSLTPVVAVVVYGNRDFGGAAVELAAFLSARKCRIAAVAAFVGEHSYSTEATPIATGRPDEADLAAAAELGRAVRLKLADSAWTEADATRLKHPRSGLLSTLRFARFVLRYRRHPERFAASRAPRTDAARCEHCGRCVRLCPNAAIAKGDETHTDAQRCIRCCACVKGCPAQARTFTTPFAPVLARNFGRRKAPVSVC